MKTKEIIIKTRKMSKWTSVVFVIGVLLLLVYFGAANFKTKRVQEAAKITQADAVQNILEDEGELLVGIDEEMHIKFYRGDTALFGYSEEEVVGRHIRILLSGKDSEDVIKNIAARLKALKNRTDLISVRRTVECVGKRKDGITVEMVHKITIFPKPTEDGVISVAWISRKK